MPVLTWISGTLLILHFAHSNVLLTANLGDVHGMMRAAKELVQAPVFNEISRIWQRASHQIKKQYYKELAKIRSEKQKHPKHNFDMDYEAPAQYRHRPKSNRQFKEGKAKRSSHDRFNYNRRRGGVNERLNESVVNDRPSQDDLDEKTSNGDADKKRSQGDVNERPSKSNDDKRPSQVDLDKGPSKGHVDKIPSQGNVNERQSLKVNPSQGNIEERPNVEASPSQDNVEDDVLGLGKNASSYLKSIALLLLHTANSYILLTANLEDVQTLAKQLIQSPVAGQIGNIVRRAANQFNRQYNDQLSKTKRSNTDENLRDADPEAADRDQDERNEIHEEDDTQAERRSDSGDSLVALGKTASVYLRSIKRMFERL